MGKKGNWFSALKKAFSSSPKEKPTNVHQLVAQFPSPHGHAREKKRWSGFGRSRQHAEPTSPAAGALINIPLYREPSSIEKILGDAEMDQQRQYYAATTRAQYQITPVRATAAVAASAASAAAPLPQPVATARERERERREDKPAAVVLPLPPPSPPPLIRRFDHDREQQQKLQQLQLQQQIRAETEWRQQQPRRHRVGRQRAAPPDRARAAAVAIQAAFRGYMASAAELPVAARADPAAGRDAGRERAAADGAGDAVHADAGPRAGAGARQPRGGHGAAQPAAPRRHAQGRRQVARRLTGRRHLGRQPADAGGGRRPDEAEGGGRDQARESPRLRLLASAAEGDADGGPRDPGGPAVGPEPLVVDAHRARPRAGGIHPRRARQQAPAGCRLRPPRGYDDADNGDDAGRDDAGPVGGLGLLQAEGREAGQEGTPTGVEPRGEHPRRREPDELPGVRRGAQLHDAHAVGLRQGAGAGSGSAAAAAAAAEGGPGEAQVLLRARPEHRELGQEPVLEGRRRRAAVVAGGHAGGVGGRREAPAHEVHQRAERRLHGVHAGRARQALQVDYAVALHAFVLGICGRDWWWCGLVWVSNAFGGGSLCFTSSGTWLLCLEAFRFFEGPVGCAV